MLAFDILFPITGVHPGIVAPAGGGGVTAAQMALALANAMAPLAATLAALQESLAVLQAGQNLLVAQTAHM